jgi:hypothetical protein
MNCSARLASAAVVAALVVGSAGPAVAARDHHAPGSASARPGAVSVKDRQQALKAITSLGQQLQRYAAAPAVKQLAPADRAAVLAGIAADRAALDKSARKVTQAKSSAAIRKVRAEISRYHAQNYRDIADLLARASELLDYVDEERSDLADFAGDPSIADPAGLSAALDSAEAQVTAAGAAARHLNARSSTSDLAGVDDALARTESDIDDVDDAIWGSDDTADDTADDTGDDTGGDV